ncbi:zinc-binding dehydrogenase [Umezawaea endophytica]|uniref:Zinc-binding dehydrogenase n=1 Tax=Umezawaea endophytica TaxID=1654476 RepID=A0A9X3A5H4_9PSEU|nr:zinc-binding dehydrogenase [Umezawaea endophytica]MCS7483809.1 zinc-binding dehydrogenase [Umezawaea endophytica]
MIRPAWSRSPTSPRPPTACTCHTCPPARPWAPPTHGLAIAVELAERGRLRIPVAGSFPLAEVAAAHALSETGHARGKIALLH